MKKIPTLFQRTEDRRYVVDEVTPGCEWVLAGEGVATRKFDGTCVLMQDDDEIVVPFVRREVKAGKKPPPSFVPVDYDEVTGKTVGWEPAEQSGFVNFVLEAMHNEDGADWSVPGTYELCGPKINGNPERLERHMLLRHGGQVYGSADDLTFDGLRDLFTSPDFIFEGIVWHHPDGRMVKLKKRDFPAPVTSTPDAPEEKP